MGHAPPRPRSPRERPFQGAGYYPPTAPWSVRRSPTVGQAASSVLAGMVTAAIFFAEGTPTVFGVAAALTSGCLVALLVDRVEQILRPAEPTRARWLAEPPLSLPGLSDHAARTYYAAAVQALMDDAMTPAEFEAALDLLWHEPKKAVADQRMKAAVARVGREVVWESDGERQYRRRHSGPSDAEVLAVQVEAGAAKTVAQLIESGSLSPAAARETLGMLSPAFLTEEQVQREIARPDPDQLERRRT